MDIGVFVIKINKRRTVLGSIALGAALPKTWTQPLVSRVILPAHAMTSCQPLEPPTDPQCIPLAQGVGRFNVGDLFLDPIPVLENVSCNVTILADGISTTINIAAKFNDSSMFIDLGFVQLGCRDGAFLIQNTRNSIRYIFSGFVKNSLDNTNSGNLGNIYDIHLTVATRNLSNGLTASETQLIQAGAACL